VKPSLHLIVYCPLSRAWGCPDEVIKRGSTVTKHLGDYELRNKVSRETYHIFVLFQAILKHVNYIAMYKPSERF
jgi:hypothetical protein